jgi:membrane-bound serine protease (ClpP class)
MSTGPGRRAGLALVLAAGLLGWSAGTALGADGPSVASVVIDGVIGPVTVRQVETALERARAQGVRALVIQLDTPGGLEKSMRMVAQRILNADVPVIVYVAPTGARAASAGVFITMAAHVAAMAPATNIGAAHPVAVGGSVDKESMRKIENDAAAFVRTLAIERGRNAEWAEKAVRESVSATEREALRLRVIDLVADSLPALLEQVDGRVVRIRGAPVTLATRGAVVVPLEVGLRDRFLAIITDPNVAYILMMLGMLGLFFELSNPGVIVPGVIGGISLILAFYAFQSLPINFAGLLLILLGLVLLVAEIKVVSHGVLAIGGVIAMALGSIMLFDTPGIRLAISWWLLAATVSAVAGAFLVAMTAGARALRRPPLLGVGGMIGATGVTRERLAPEGLVLVAGELWRAVAQKGNVEEGRPVRVVGADGLTLAVVPVEGGKETP